MRLTLFPTSDGCYRPALVAEKSRALLDAGRTVAISSRDVSLAGLEGATVVRRIDELHRILDDRPDYLVVDALDFADPDGRMIVNEQNRPSGLPKPIDGDWFVSVLKELARGVTREVMLVCVNTDVSRAWLARLDALGVKVYWDLADSDRWRHWTQVRGKDDIRKETEDMRLGQLADPGNTAIAAFYHSTRSQLLLTLCAEYSDIHLTQADRNPPVDPVQVLSRLLAGRPLEERIAMTGDLVEDLKILTMMAQDLHGSMKGLGRSNPPPRPVRKASVHPITGRKLH